MRYPRGSEGSYVFLVGVILVMLMGIRVPYPGGSEGVFVILVGVGLSSFFSLECGYGCYPCGSAGMFVIFILWTSLTLDE